MLRASQYDRKCWFALILFFVFANEKAVAQKRNGLYADSLFRKYALTPDTGYNPDKPYYICRCKPRESPFIRPVRTLSGNLSVVQIGNRQQYDSLHKNSLAAPASNAWKLSPALERSLNAKSNAEMKFIVTGLIIDSLLTILQGRTEHLTILRVDRPSRSVLIRCKLNFLLKELLGLREVIFADAAAEAHTETNIIGYDRSFHGINAVDYLLPGADGQGIVVGVKEQKMDEGDIDLWKRVLPSSLSAPTTSYHATVISCIIGGAGNSSYEGRGIAWKCSFFPSSFSNLFADDSSVLNTNRVSVQNHSYGTIIQPFYGAEAVSYDVLTWNNKQFVAVMSSGNQGESTAAEGRYANLSGFANLTGNFKAAKNIITIGAINNDETIPVQSSAGPLYDGRMAPQLTALGPSGTSDAAAVVSGTVSVMQQVYAGSNNRVLPPASLIKAILYNTADDIYKPGIDYKTGYGLLNSFAAIKSVLNRSYDGGFLSNGQQWTKTISVPENTAELKVTLAWTDSAATVNNDKAIQNDLDLEVLEMSSSTVYQPWVLNALPDLDSLTKPPARRRDSLNTAEQVSIRLPKAGVYQIKVKGTSVITPAIPFHVSYKTDTLNTFVFTSPLQAYDVDLNNGRPVTIRWKTFVADTAETGNLFISYNGGNTWETLIESVKLVSGKYAWPAKDTNTTAMLKMETSFGRFLSDGFVISRPIRIQVDFNCVDSFRLSWNKHRDAKTYQLYALVDSPYLKPILSTADTFAVLQRSVYPSMIYAVEPVLYNGMATARSSAVNIELQVVHCFYRTLNYELIDGNKLNLSLELSIATYADSVFFERVTATGQLLQTYGGAGVNAPNLIYRLMADEVPAGVTYLRGRIKLKTGAVVYTDIVPVLTSGKRLIWFYPNPANRNTSLNYVLQQGVPPGPKLLLFDANGRLLKQFQPLPDNINLSGLQSGMIIYRLMDDQNKTLETGKFIIMN